MNIDGNALHQYGEGAAIAIISILMVFVILLLIIILTELVTKVAGKNKTVEVQTNTAAVVHSSVSSKLNVNDEDAVVASIVASIDYRNETKKNIQVISIREVK